MKILFHELNLDFFIPFVWYQEYNVLLKTNGKIWSYHLILILSKMHSTTTIGERGLKIQFYLDLRVKGPNGKRGNSFSARWTVEINRKPSKPEMFASSFLQTNRRNMFTSVTFNLTVTGGHQLIYKSTSPHVQYAAAFEC